MLIDEANIIRQKRRTIKIIINDNGLLSIYCPKTISNAKIEEILESKEKLLQKKINKIKTTNDRFNTIITYEQVLLLGKKYFVIPTSKVGKGYFTDDSLLIPQKYAEAGKISFYIKKILKEFANKIIISRVECLSKISKKYKYNKIVIGNFKSKWGSCDNLGVLKFNWKLIMMNSQVIDFVIYHELTHLIELNHSKNFYINLENVCPNWKIYRKSLKEYSFLLNLYN